MEKRTKKIILISSVLILLLASVVGITIGATKGKGGKTVGWKTKEYTLKSKDQEYYVWWLGSLASHPLHDGHDSWLVRNYKPDSGVPYVVWATIEVDFTIDITVNWSNNQFILNSAFAEINKDTSDGEGKYWVLQDGSKDSLTENDGEWNNFRPSPSGFFIDLDGYISEHMESGMYFNFGFPNAEGRENDEGIGYLYPGDIFLNADEHEIDSDNWYEVEQQI